MKILAAKLVNYGAFHGEHWFSYSDRGLTMVLGENLDEPRMNSNGSAKSTLFECLDWCLYGKVPKGDHADSIINEECKSCSVTVLLEDDDGTPAAVERSRPSALKFWINSEEQTFLDTGITQIAIEKFLGMDRDVFHASVFFAQTDLMHFADVTDARRVELLSKIIPEMSAVDALLDKAKVKRDEVNQGLVKAQHESASLQGKLDGLQSIDYVVQKQEWEGNRQADIAKLTARIATLNTYIEEHTPHLVALESLEAEAAGLSGQPAIPKPETAGLWDAEQAVQRNLSAHAVAQAEGTRLRNAIQKIEGKASGTCRECGQAITVEHLQLESTRLQAELEEASRKTEAAHSEWLEAQEVVAGLKGTQAQAESDWRAAEEVRTRSLNEVNQKLNSLRQLQTYLDNARREIHECGTKIQTAQTAVNPFLEEERKLEERREAFSLELEGAVEKLEELTETREYVEFWVKAFGPKGLKNYILDSKLQEMTDAANHWVKLLSGGTFWIRFETQKKGRSTKKLTNELNIRVFRYNPDGRISDRNYKSWSGGEKGRVSLAIDIGLSRLIANRAAKRYDILVLDELFKHVDKAGGEAIAEMLEELAREKSSLFVIEHDGDFVSRFENQVMVRRKNARSTIVEKSNAEGTSDRQTPSRTAVRTKAKPKRKARRSRVPSRAPAE